MAAEAAAVRVNLRADVLKTFENVAEAGEAVRHMLSEIEADKSRPTPDFLEMLGCLNEAVADWRTAGTDLAEFDEEHAEAEAA